VTLQIVQDETADEVLSTNAFALLCGMLLQQQAPIDVAFAGPARILDRFGTLDPSVISEASPEEFAELCATEPAVHPYPESMSVLIQAMARYIVVNYAGDTAAVWKTAGSGEHLLSRLTLMPGFGRRKAQMFVALLGRQLNVRPRGWEKAAGPYAQPGGFRSVADIHDRVSLDKVLNARSARRQGEREAGDGRPADRRSAHATESRGLKDMSTENIESSEEDTDLTTDEPGEVGGAGERRAAKKAARRAARKAQRREAQEAAGGTSGQGGDDSADDAEADDDSDTGSGEGTGDPGEKLTAEERAERKARKAAKRAARRSAAGKDPEGQGGRRAGGRKGAQGRGGRDRTLEGGAASGAESGGTAESPVPQPGPVDEV